MKATYTKYLDLICRQFKKNLKKQIKKMGNVKASKIASVCHASQSTVGRWLKDEDPSLPDLPNLYMLADFFGCSIYNLLESENDVSYYLTQRPIQFETYSEEFTFCLRLYHSSFLSFKRPEYLINSIEDPILKFLVKSFFNNMDLVQRGEATDSQLMDWIEKVKKDFSIFDSQATPDEIYDVLYSMQDLDLYSKHLRAAIYLQEGILEYRIKQLKQNDELIESNLDTSLTEDSEYEFN